MKYPVIDKRKTGKRIKILMQLSQIRPEQIRKYLNLSCVQTVYRRMRGENIPSVDHLYALSVLLDVRVDDLIVGSREKRQVFDLTNGRVEYKSSRVCRMLLYYERMLELAV